MEELYLWAMWFSGLLMGIGISAGAYVIKLMVEEWVGGIVRRAVADGADKKGNAEP